MSENKTLGRSSDDATNEWWVGPEAWISLVVVLLAFSGLLFGVERMAQLGAFDFTIFGSVFGTMKTPETNTFIGSSGIGTRAGFLFALSLVPMVVLVLGLLEIFTHYGAIYAAYKLLALLLRPLLGIPGYTGLALTTDLQSTDAGAALTKELYDSKEISRRDVVIMGIWQYSSVGLINNYFSVGSVLLALLTTPITIPLLLMFVLKFVGAVVTRLVLNTAYKGDSDNE